ncbi:hypothetical protein [Haliangium sp.]|uniref:hypothetical protein n=1 Tax=Haliangium sp. TaxID=2663208 RepID=UPI003D0DADB9
MGRLRRLLATPVDRLRARRGRILAIKWGLNPNSSSLGVDVTFLLFGASALAMVTPVIAALIRWRAPEPPPSDAEHGRDGSGAHGA